MGGHQITVTAGHMMGRAFLVGAGGFFGASARYLVGDLVDRLLPSTFPFATLFINVMGCLAIGFMAVLMREPFLPAPGSRLFWMVGFLGGYTTFSTFGYETLVLLRLGYTAAFVNIASHLVLGLLAVFLGAAAAHLVS